MAKPTPPRDSVGMCEATENVQQEGAQACLSVRQAVHTPCLNLCPLASLCPQTCLRSVLPSVMKFPTTPSLDTVINITSVSLYSVSPTASPTRLPLLPLCGDLWSSVGRPEALCGDSLCRAPSLPDTLCVPL